MNFDFELPKDVTRIWELPVPYISTENETHAYITEEIGAPSEYDELCYLLRSAPKGHTFHLHINTPGGVIDSALAITAAIKASQAHIIGHLAGTVASAGTMISMACNELIIEPHLSFLIHNYSGGIHGKGGELKARQAHDEQVLKDVFEDFYTNFLTPEEIAEVIEDKDMWMGTAEVQRRWNNKHAIDTLGEPKKKRGRPRKNP